ncbi:putative bifunctional diguanylate cyclase/phosphodiesterase [Aromatoleum petrolei]|uniref:EAL domain-containing protein n=1 Tax=Aromatoleum petrolei TaxID=76116 RepID=A0ABX1MYC1_9RHOO|nr:EAL domain-containing protein [Aromatoleum petrolei]NMF90057.1 EAL domain-containing protein [Aromatoleum petrolei]QTQ36158.1 Putative diguanylate cyclase/phosphodiesterase [Aromatoleum petrolei]
MSYAERALRTLSAGNRTLLRAQDEATLLHDMCRVIVELGGYRMAWVGYAEHDEAKTIRPMAHMGFEEGFLELGRFTWAEGESESSRGPTSQAIRSGKPVVVQDTTTLASTQLPVPLEETLRRGYASIAAFPLIIQDRTIGNLTIFAAEADAFDECETRLLAEMADDLAFGIANLRMRERHREAEETIRHMAFFDALTDLPNRSSVGETLAAEITQAQLENQSMAVLLLKVGRFQEISDTLGYQEGDHLIVEMAARLRHLAGPDKSVARVGEDEFAIIMPRSSAEAAMRVAHHTMREACDPVDFAGLAMDPHAYIGISLFPGHGNTPEALLRRAKIAAVQARRTACKYTLYKGTEDRESTRRLELMSELRSAIDHNELLLYCQPKVSIRSGEVCGAEALVRWQHPQHGMIATGEFIALAEHAGLIMPLTRWVLEAAFRQSYAWHERGIARPLSVNLSAQDLRDPRLIDRISGLFATWALPPELVQFELTESALMEDPAGALETLDHLKDLGVDLFIDDFGIGYSSLSYLQKLPVDSLKIDHSFVTSMLENQGSAVIVHSTVELGHNLGLGVVAEGVESEGLWNRLQELGCDTAQGHFVGRPIPTAQFDEWEAQSPWSHPAPGNHVALH